MKAAGYAMLRLYRALLTVGVLSVLITAWAGGAHALPNPFIEVPSQHWTYGALERMATLGLTTRSSEGVRRLGWQLTRVEMALEVAEVLDRLDLIAEHPTDNGDALNGSGGAGNWNVNALVQRYNDAVPMESQLTAVDKELLESLVMYFRSDLEALGYRMEPGTAGVSGANPSRIQVGSPSIGQLRVSGTGVLRYNEFVAQQPEFRISGASMTQNYALDLGYVDETLRLSATLLTTATHPPRNQEGINMFALTSFEIAYDNRMIARIGDLSDHSWSDLAITPNHPLQGLQAGIQIGSLGSTVLFAHSRVAGADEYLAGLDSTLYLDRMTLGASLVHSTGVDTHPSEGKAETVASLQGTYRLTPGLLLTGGLAGNVWSDRNASAFHLAGLLQYSDRLSVAAKFRMRDDGFQRALAAIPEPGGKEFDLEFDFGQTQLRAGIGRSEWEESDASGIATTASLGLRYPVTDLTFLRAEASRSVYDGGHPENRMVIGSNTTAVGLDFLTPRLNLSLGYALEEFWGEGLSRLPASRTGEAEVEYRLFPNTRALAGLSVVDEEGGGQRLTTDLGVDYDLLGGSISLRYQVIDFSGIESIAEESRSIGAEFTIRF